MSISAIINEDLVLDSAADLGHSYAEAAFRLAFNRNTYKEYIHMIDKETADALYKIERNLTAQLKLQHTEIIALKDKLTRLADSHSLLLQGTNSELVKLRKRVAKLEPWYAEGDRKIAEVLGEDHPENLTR